MSKLLCYGFFTTKNPLMKVYPSNLRRIEANGIRISICWWIGQDIEMLESDNIDEPHNHNHVPGIARKLVKARVVQQQIRTGLISFPPK